MRRRDFLAATAGLTGTMVPLLVRGESKPCPPEVFGVIGQDPVAAKCTSTGAAPPWFVNMPEKSWYPVASPSSALGGKQIDDATVGWQGEINGGALSGVCTDWAGGCVDQVRGELLFVANGGHGGYSGNEGYACAIRRDVPTWYRLNNPSVGATVTTALTQRTASISNLPAGQGGSGAGYAAIYMDGRSRAMHASHMPQYVNGKVWFHIQNSIIGGDGGGPPQAWTFNRTYGTIPTTPGGTPMAHPYPGALTVDPGPWTWLGTTTSGNKGDTAIASDWGSSNGFEPSGYDPVTGLIWTAHSATPTRVWVSLDTGAVSGTPNVFRRSDTTNSFANPAYIGWAVVVYDPSGQDRWRFWVAYASTNDALIVLNLKAANVYATNDWLTPGSPWSMIPLSNAALVESASSCGAIYHKPSKSILLGNPRALGGNLVKIRVPTNGDGSYAGGTWQASTVNPSAGSSTIAMGTTQQTYSKFNMIEDMGNGQSALVVCMSINAPAYVYKLPVQGI